MGWHFLGYNNKSSFVGIVKNVSWIWWMFHWHEDLKTGHKIIQICHCQIPHIDPGNLSQSISIMQYCDIQLIVIFNYVFSPFYLHYISLKSTFESKQFLSVSLWKELSCYILKIPNISIGHYYILVDRCQILLFISIYVSIPTVIPWKNVHYAIAFSYIN